MNATGIVAEYNPFHNGHALHINKTKEKLGQPVIVVMSGSFVQRGEPAFLDKWTRAKLAASGGANLVLELPTVFSLRSAEFFARGSVELLAATGLVNVISCGAEHPENNFNLLAQKYLEENTQKEIKKYLDEGLSYAVACEKALGSELSAPNDILAFEYAKACLKSGLKLHTFQREGSGYNEQTLGALASATAIRKAFDEGKLSELSECLPSYAFASLETNGAGYSKNKLWSLIQYALVHNTTQEIAELSECSEGLENLLKSAEAACSLEEALQICTNKRYSTSRIRRLFMQLLFDKSVEIFKQEHPAYIRVLAFDDVGRELLKEMKQSATLPIINKLGQHPEHDQSREFTQSIFLDVLATNLRELVGNADAQLNRDFTTSPFYKK
ncbi:MAG: nucleotidyltransferase family protein [Phascolarctobacterium sp.]|nr:nucleotidyltransferase family protein [Phascolarctobacterium sp.]